MTLPGLWRVRDLVEADLHETYGIDVDLSRPQADLLLQQRSWRWLLVRILGLLRTDRTRVWAHFAPDQTKTEEAPHVV